ncbi:MarR family winged helix-turn-helix transcriptional regulator [Levilactobacillus yiduensis]|uniref:MarR family winged helix-turn-helix transcriptional regulator n=1 Tax=Levilactobacillus yiduensis TaxID=2953880 RepID=UPI000EF2A372|nr:MarR family transcriptional regulator [Levilactobacillus yiduensis]AYM02354.1 MarR family transcriptional regulator [Levilactobacillus brevis]
MTEKSRDLMKIFGKLLQNRALMMTVGHQPGLGGHGGPGGRGQMGLLQVLSQSTNGLTNAEIAEILDIRPSSVSALITKLVDAELVERVPSETDKRAVIVKLSAQGREMFDQYDERMDDWSTKLFAGLTDAEQTQLADLLTKFNHHVDDLDWHEMMGHGHPHFGMRGRGPMGGWPRF